MTKRWVGFAVLLTVAVLSMITAVAAEETGRDGGEWWNIPYSQPFDAASLSNSLDPIRVEGNQFVDEQGDPVEFRGVAIADPDKLALQDRWSKDLFEEIGSWGANIIRVPIHPVAWRGRGKQGYLELLDDAVRWATDLGLYLMIDWHSIGNLETGLFQHPMYDTTKQETLEFWRTIAARYKGVPTTAFYEIFNEPTVYNGQLGTTTWSKWKAFNEEVIGVIYAHDRNVIPLVAGFNWAYSLTPVAAEPIEAEGVGYVSHPYPQKVEAPWEEKWEQDFGFVADEFPVFVTEFGFKPADQPGAHMPVIGDEEYGTAITDYFAKNGISWAAWCFDPDWGPQLISDWDYTPTMSGAFFKGVMTGDR
jgi:aryl-phospho-beta-D-glucosidase BglC (GH1 family)